MRWFAIKFIFGHQHTCPNCQKLFKSSELIKKPTKRSQQSIFYAPQIHTAHIVRKKLIEVFDKKFLLKVGLMTIFMSFLLVVLSTSCGVCQNFSLFFSIIYTLLIGFIVVVIIDKNIHYEKADDDI